MTQGLNFTIQGIYEYKLCIVLLNIYYLVETNRMPDGRITGTLLSDALGGVFYEL